MCRIFPARLVGSRARIAESSTELNPAPSPWPTQSVPSVSVRMVPIMCEPDSAGMQSTLFAGAGQGPLWVPRMIVGEPPPAASRPVDGLSV